MRDLLSRIRSVAFVATVAWGIGSGCPPLPPQADLYVSGYEVANNGTEIRLYLSVSPPAGTLYVRCLDYTPFDTVAVDDGTYSLVYSLDSTFLASCSEHLGMFLTYAYGDSRSSVVMDYSGVPVGYVGYPNLPRRVVIDHRDTVVVNGDSSGYVLTSNAYVRFAPYEGGMYAPLPPGPYTDTLTLPEGSTAVVWIDHDRDGAVGYDGDDLFGVLTVTFDDLRFSSLAVLHTDPDLTGYRGLDLCFRCSE